MAEGINAELPLPPRWLRCPRKGNLIDDLFLPMKTPLDERYDDQVPEEYRFNLRMIFNSMKQMKRKMGILLDLTFTTRFYDSKKVREELDCGYIKIKCRGHGQAPTIEETEAFMTAVDSVVTNRPNEVIGVHCTHGFNRTGFLIVCYLIDKRDWDLEAALSLFIENRSPGIYKQDYINELYKRYYPEETPPNAPSLPDWHVEFDDNDRDDDGKPIASRKKNRGQNRKDNAVFVEGLDIPQVEQFKDYEQVSRLQNEVKIICSYERNGFAGAQPVSMDRQNISLLGEKRYKVSWKADGVRYLMYIKGKEQIFMFDRDNTVFKVNNLTFPRRKFPEDSVFDTLVDGELVVDQHEGQKIPRFLIYDIVQFESKPVGRCDFGRREICIQRELIGPRTVAMEERRIIRESEPFGIRIKEFHDITYAERFFREEFTKAVAHETDGLIFQPFEWVYKGGRTHLILKWKPPELNSVDFLLKIVVEKREGCPPEKTAHLFVGGLHPPFCSMKCPKEFREYNNKIIECTWEVLDRGGGKWKFLRERKDKSFPNSYETATGE
ncbi:DgyrCDS12724 [Dimorphilus gyrociliatus]|uniref:mRNA-capping enzyme n=1 Tax=Dimorphilus gyrociliatus TaxID=2664684 RepID=A0A7I8W845_9ANNE|nr:DgyrCDS12724 [Dimorphilus gyrociliatus]